MPAEGQPPNVLFVMADQQSADSFGPGRHPCAAMIEHQDAQMCA